jgi:hypothetical protein
VTENTPSNVGFNYLVTPCAAERAGVPFGYHFPAATAGRFAAVCVAVVVAEAVASGPKSLHAVAAGSFSVAFAAEDAVPSVTENTLTRIRNKAVIVRI